MAWRETARRQYERRNSRYASDLTDAEWSIIEPLMPAARLLGRPRKTDLREIVNALLYIASSGDAWRITCRWPLLNFDPTYEFRINKGSAAHPLISTIGRGTLLGAINQRGNAVHALQTAYIHIQRLACAITCGKYAWRMAERVAGAGRWDVAYLLCTYISS